MTKLIFKNTIDLEIDYVTTWFAPFEKAGKTILPKGTIIEALTPVNGEESSVIFKPVKYKDLEKIIVPVSDREDIKYNDYFLGVDFDEFEKFFELINYDSIKQPLTLANRIKNKIK